MKHEGGETLCADLLDFDAGIKRKIESYGLALFLERNDEKRSSVLLLKCRDIWSTIKPEVEKVQAADYYSDDDDDDDDNDDGDDEYDDDSAYAGEYEPEAEMDATSLDMLSTPNSPWDDSKLQQRIKGTVDEYIATRDEQEALQSFADIISQIGDRCVEIF
jgi:hypothetical protein